MKVRISSALIHRGSENLNVVRMSQVSGSSLAECGMGLAEPGRLLRAAHVRAGRARRRGGQVRAGRPLEPVPAHRQTQVAVVPQGTLCHFVHMFRVIID